MTKGTGTGTNQQPNQPKYQITATIEKIDVDSKDIQLQLKGCGKCFFEPENDKSVKYNILECLQTYTPIPQPMLFNSKDNFYIDTNNNNSKNVASNLLSKAFIENKRLKFEIEHNSTSKSNLHKITSISKAD